MSLLENVDWQQVAKALDTEKTFRSLHLLKPVNEHKPAAPKRAVFYDSEAITRRQPNGDTLHERYIIVGTFVDYEKGFANTARYGSPVARSKDPSLQPIEHFWQHLIGFTRRDFPLYVFAHNAGYDMLATGGAKALFELGYVAISHPYEVGQTFIWRVGRLTDRKRKSQAKHSHTIEFLSSTNYYPMKLAKLGAIFASAKTHQEPETD